MKRTYFIAATLCLVILLVGCTPQATPAPLPPARERTPSPGVVSTPAPETPLPSAQEREWEKVMQEAKKEGKVNVYVATLPVPARAPLAKAFREKYGITVEYVPGRGTEIAEKIAMEQRAKAYVADIFEAGADVPILTLKPDGLLAEPVNVPSALQERNLWRVDPLKLDPYIFIWYNLGTFPMINTNLVRPEEEPKSWFDFLEPRWKGKILMDDPAIPGPGGTTFVTVKNYIGGVDYWRRMARQDPKIIRGWQEQVSMVVRGEYSLLVGVHGGFAATVIAAGAPVKMPVLKEGVHSGAWSVVLIKNAPHLNAARLFLNWFLSQEGQTVFSRATKFASTRSDVSQEHALPGFRWSPDIKVYVHTREDFLGRPKDFELAREIFGLK